MNNFSRLYPDIILTHILPRLDGETLIVLSSVSHEFRRMICKNNEDLWLNTCTSTWPSLLCDSFLNKVISKFPGGCRSFFSDAFPSIHHFNHSPPLPPAPPETHFICLIDVSLKGERQPLFTSIDFDIISTREYHPLVPNVEEYSAFELSSAYNNPQRNLNLNFIHVKKEECEEYLEENLRLSWVVIELNRKRAGSLFHSRVKPVSVKSFAAYFRTKAVYKTVIPGLSGLSRDYTEMVKCKVKVNCDWEGGDDGRFYVNNLELQMKDMNGKHVWRRHGAKILLNAIENGERKKKGLEDVV